MDLAASPTAGEPSPPLTPRRNSFTDANAALARKRPRLSASPAKPLTKAASPSPNNSPPRSPVIEIVEPDTVQEPPPVIIDLDGDITMDVGRIQDFPFINMSDWTTPEAASRGLGEYLDQGHPFNVLNLHALVDWLENHISLMAERAAEWPRYYEAGKLFWDHLGNVIRKLAHRGNAKNCRRPNDSNKYSAHDLQDLVRRLYYNYTLLCLRFLHIDAMRISDTGLRRDSALAGDSPAILLSATPHVKALGDLLQQRCLVKMFLFSIQEADKLLVDTVEWFVQDGSPQKDLLTLFETAVRRSEGIQDSLETSQACLGLSSVVLRTLPSPLLRQQAQDSIYLGSASELFRLASEVLLPKLCKFQPRNLPENFHRDILDATEKILATLMSVNNHMISEMLDNAVQYVSSLVEERPAASGSEGSTQELPCHVLNLSFRTGSSSPTFPFAVWRAGVCIGYLTSEIIFLRGIGLEKLNIVLTETYRQCEREPDNLTLQCVARILRCKAGVSYFMGPLTHPDLIRRSAHVINFLLVTHNISTADIDVMWSTVATNQQAEIVEAGYIMLEQLLQYMDVEHLVHLAKKIGQLPIQHAGKHALRLLNLVENAFIDRAVPGEQSAQLRFEMIMNCVQLLRTVGSASFSPGCQALQAAAYASIKLLLTPELLERTVSCCLTEMNRNSALAAGCACVLLQVLDRPDLGTSWAVEAISIPLKDLCHYVDEQRTANPAICRPQVLLPRIQLVLQLLVYLPMDDRQVVEMTLWKYLVSEEAINHSARSAALNEIIANKERDTATGQLYWRCITSFLPKLPAEYATDAVYALLHDSLADDSTWEATQSDDNSFSIHTEILRLAFGAPDSTLAKELVSLLIASLFDPTLVRHHRDIALAAQVSTVRQCLECLFRRDGRFVEAVNLLTALLQHSRGLHRSQNHEPQLDLTRKVIRIEGSEQGDLVRIPVSGVHDKLKWDLLTPTTATLEQLSRTLSNGTGFKEFSLFGSGQAVDLKSDPQKTIAEAGLQRKGQLLIKKVYTVKSITDECDNKGVSNPVEAEILQEQERLNTCLDDPEEIGRTAYKLMLQFPFQPSIRRAVASPRAAVDDVFPPDKPWKAMYAVGALQGLLQDQLRLGIADEAFLVHGVHVLIELAERNNSADKFLAAAIACALFSFLKERPVTDVSREYFQNPSRFVSRMMDLTRTGKDCLLSTPGSTPVPQLDELLSIMHWSYDCLLEGIRLQPLIGEALATADGVIKDHKHLLLSSSPAVSDKITNSIYRLCEDGNVSSVIKAFYWGVVSESLKDALNEPVHSGQLFHLAPEILRSNESVTSDESQMMALVDRFSAALLALDHVETFGSDMIDARVSGLAILLKTCVTFLKRFKQPLNLTILAAKLFTKFLFPNRPSKSVTDGSAGPIISPHSRAAIYDLILLLCEDTQVCDDLVALLDRAVQDTTFSERFFDGETRLLRASCGRVGISNLGQTCYMNSLLQQLYMNTNFRKFILATPVTDPEKQAVLHEFQECFATLQDSYVHAYFPERLAQVLGVDKDVQEDAHIFFTTMIGKLEDSMPSDQAKQELKRFFAGKNRSQTRGDCGHVSESADEYCNLSLVVKNKTSLKESLDEYVVGGALEGGDKFKCLACDPQGKAYVNAKRRTGLDQIPDNLVLGLKRFRYETFDGGEKVNDHFQFPEQIDMAPYKLQNLNDPTAPRKSDIFDLVGVVVHQGYLDRGHYWSYAKQRPSMPTESPLWFRLEDDSARHSSVQEVLQETTGGLSDDGRIREDSAYVLFYQRLADTFEVDDRPNIEPSSRAGQSTKVFVPEHLESKISQDNQNLVRQQHLMHPLHARFVLNIFGLLDRLTKGQPTADYKSEMTVLSMALVHLHWVIVRNEALPCLKEIIEAIQRVALSAPVLAYQTVEHLVGRDEGARHFIMHKKPEVRWLCQELVIRCLTFLKRNSPELYGLDADGGIITKPPGLICQVALGHMKARDDLPYRSRVWGEYLGLAGQIALLGQPETELMIRAGNLKWCLDVLYLQEWEDAQLRLPEIYQYMQTNRKYNLSAVIDCIAALLCKHVTIFRRNGGRNGNQADSDLVLLNEEELEMFWREDEGECNFFVQEVCDRYGKNREPSLNDWTPGKLVDLLTGTKTPTRLRSNVIKTLIHALKEYEEPVPFLKAAWYYCRSGYLSDAKFELIEAAARLAHRVEWLAIPNVRTFMKDTFLYEPVSVLECTKHWILKSLHCADEDVEQGTLEWLKEHIFDHASITIPQTDTSMRLDVYRSTAATVLLGQCNHAIRTSLKECAVKGDFQRVIDAFIGLFRHLRALVETADALEEEQDQGSLSAVEAGESTASESSGDTGTSCEGAANHLGEHKVHLDDAMQRAVTEARVAIRENAQLFDIIQDWSESGVEEEEAPKSRPRGRVSVVGEEDHENDVSVEGSDAEETILSEGC